MSMGFAFVSVLSVYFGEVAVILYYGVFARVYVTELGLLRGNFQCPLGQQFTVVIYVCTFTCACGFTLPSVWGVLLSFLFFLRVCRASCSVWSSLLFLSPHCAVMWYSWVGPFVCGFFQVFSGPHCDLHPIACWQVCCQFFLSQLLHHLGIQWQSQRLHREHRIHFQTRSWSWWPMHFNISLLIFVSTLCADNHVPLVSSAAPFPPSVLSVVSSSAMVAASSLASTSGTLRLPPFVSMFTTTFTINSSCLDGLAQSITAPIMVSHASSLFLAATVWPHCATRHL